MADAHPELGIRIVEAARLALIMHLGQLHDSPRQPASTGGAGSRFSTDGELLAAGGRHPRPPHLAEGGAA